MNDHETALEELAIRFVLGEMGPDGARDFRAQLQRDPNLNLIVTSVADCFGAVAESLPQVAPPASLRDNRLRVKASLQRPFSSQAIGLVLIGGAYGIARVVASLRGGR